MIKLSKVLIVGFGSIGQRHFKNIKKLYPNIEIGILRSSNNKKNITHENVFFDLKSAIDFNPDIAFICNPATFHIDTAIKLANEKIHFFVEKPLSNNLDKINELKKIIKKNNIKGMVGYNLRFNDSLLFFKQFIEKNDLGDILFISSAVGQYLPAWRPSQDYKKTVSAQSALGGGALLELSHELDYLIWIFGRPVSVYGKMMKVSELKIDVEDLVLSNISFHHKSRQIDCALQLDFLQHKPYRKCKILFKDGLVIWDGIKNTVELHKENECEIIFKSTKERNDSFEKEITEYINCIIGDSASPVSIDDGINVIKLIEGIKLSSKLRKVIDL